MGSTVYSQKLTHTVQVSFTCEHCGAYNHFTQDITGTGSTEVSFGSSSKYAQQKIAKVAPAAQNDLERKILKARDDTLREKFSWVKHQKCTKCKYHQSWQVGSIWRTLIGTLLWYILPVLLVSVWIDPETMTTGALIFFIVFYGALLIPIIVQIVSLIRIDRKTRNKPTVTF